MTSGDGFVDWVPTTSASTPPPQRTLQWVEEQLQSNVVEVNELVGGLSSAVHRLRLANDLRVVLRRFTLADWIAREPHIPHDEARNLAMLGELDVGIRTPVLLAADPDAQVCDVPVIVMTEVAGRPVLEPPDPGQWAEKIAQCLAGIHSQQPVDHVPRYRRWNDTDRPVPSWTTDENLWSEAIAAGKAELPAHPDGFLHRDYHPNNIHWEANEICAVVDWLSICTGPLAGDLAHCRWNLAVLFDPDLADHFLAHYRQLTGYSEDVMAFDLATVLEAPVGPFPTHAWNALGRHDLTSGLAAVRIDNWLRHLLTSG